MTEQYEQLHLPLQGEVDLEKIRQEYEANDLWNDAEKLATRSGYSGRELKKLIRSVAMAGLKASKTYKIKSEGDKTSLRSYVNGKMEQRLLEKIRQDYEMEGLWKHAEKIAKRTGYEGADLDDLIQDLALEGLKASRNFKLSDSDKGRAIGSYVYEIMKRYLARAKGNLTRQSLPYSMSRRDNEFFKQLDVLVDQGIVNEDDLREYWINSTDERSGIEFDLLRRGQEPQEEDIVPTLSCEDDDLTQQRIQAILDGHQMELWTVYLDDIFQERPLDVRRITKDEVVAVWILHRANPDMSDVKLAELMRNSKSADKWIRRRLDLAIEAIGRFYQETIER